MPDFLIENLVGTCAYGRCHTTRPKQEYCTPCLAAARLLQLRAALAALVGVDGRADLEQLEGVMRLMPAPAKDKAAMIDAIHALIDCPDSTALTNSSLRTSRVADCE